MEYSHCYVYWLLCCCFLDHLRYVWEGIAVAKNPDYRPRRKAAGKDINWLKVCMICVKDGLLITFNETGKGAKRITYEEHMEDHALELTGKALNEYAE